MVLFLILSGLVLLFVGGETLVRGCVGIARKSGLSEFVIGVTLIGFGTSLPEMVASLEALSNGSVGLSVGNVIGSNIANILLVIGAMAVTSPIVVKPRVLMRNGLFTILVTCLFAILAWFNMFSRLTGIGLVALMAIYLAVSISHDKYNTPAAGTNQPDPRGFETKDPSWLAAIMVLFGIVGVVYGARFLITGASHAAHDLGVSETVIGISVIALGTSLPELVTAIIAARKNKGDMAIGTVLGSNIFNILAILGVSAIVFPFSLVEPDSGTPGVHASFGPAMSVITWTDMVMIALPVLLLVLFGCIGRGISRWKGLVFLSVYIMYIALRFLA